MTTKSATEVFPSAGLVYIKSSAELSRAQRFRRSYLEPKYVPSIKSAELELILNRALLAYRETLELSSFEYLANGSYYLTIVLDVTPFADSSPAGQKFVETVNKSRRKWEIMLKSRYHIRKELSPYKVNELRLSRYFLASHLEAICERRTHLQADQALSRVLIVQRPVLNFNPDCERNHSLINESIDYTGSSVPEIRHIKSLKLLKELQRRRRKEQYLSTQPRLFSLRYHQMCYLADLDYWEVVERLSYSAHFWEGERGSYCPMEEGGIETDRTSGKDLTQLGKRLLAKKRRAKMIHGKRRENAEKFKVKAESEVNANFLKCLRPSSIRSAEADFEIEAPFDLWSLMAEETQEQCSTLVTQAFDELDRIRIEAMKHYSSAVSAAFSSFCFRFVPDGYMYQVENNKQIDQFHRSKFWACEKFIADCSSLNPNVDVQMDIFMILLEWFEQAFIDSRFEPIKSDLDIRHIHWIQRNISLSEP